MQASYFHAIFACKDFASFRLYKGRGREASGMGCIWHTPSYRKQLTFCLRKNKTFSGRVLSVRGLPTVDRTLHSPKGPGRVGARTHPSASASPSSSARCSFLDPGRRPASQGIQVHSCCWSYSPKTCVCLSRSTARWIIKNFLSHFPIIKSPSRNMAGESHLDREGDSLI